MANDTFVYVIYIRTTAEKLWDALREPEFTRAYWYGCHQESEWRKGASWRLVAPDGRATDTGEIIEIEPPRRLIVSWRNELMGNLRQEGHSRATFVLEPAEDAVKLTVTHEIAMSGSKLIEAVAGGWPRILSSLKSLLESGSALESTRRWPQGM
jgi:uncharacterized protein YndB with AHSA1/START domain